MTQGQIVTYCIIARCCWAKWAVRVGLLGLMGDPSFAEQKRQLILARMLLKTVECYNPDAENNCITSDDILLFINKISELIGSCGDAQSLDESDAACCDPLNGVTIVNA